MKYDFQNEKLVSRVVAIGGGTGLSTMLRGLKNYFENITAIVTVADDGGGSGMLRRDLGVAPPGDVRNCILAMAEAEPVLKKLFDYRFPEGTLEGQSFGNLFLAAMTGISKNFSQAVQRVSDVLAVTGDVFPVTDAADMRLCAKLSNGKVICGESNIGHARPDGSRIESVFLDPAEVMPTESVITAIERAELILLSSGSLYTSIIPNLLVKGVADAIYRAKAPTIYICNLMTQPGETVGYRASDHVRAIHQHAGHAIVDCVIANEGAVDEAILQLYHADGVDMVEVDHENFKDAFLVTGDYTDIRQGEKGSIVRHNTDKLARDIRRIAIDMMETKQLIRTERGKS